MIRKKKLDVVRGGIAIPIPNKDNYYYMSGRKHINGGIDLGKDPKTGLEVEDGEVIKIGKMMLKYLVLFLFKMVNLQQKEY